MHFSTLSIVVLVSLSSLACVSTHMKQFIGKDVRYIAVEDGPPVNVFDMPDDRRAFQYYWGGGSYVVPTTTTTSRLLKNSAKWDRQIDPVVLRCSQH